MENGSALQSLTDLVQVIVKMLGRPAVQQQLLAVALILVLAGVVARLFRSWLQRDAFDQSEAGESEEAFPESGMVPGEEPESESSPEAELDSDGEPTPPPTWRQRGTDLAWAIGPLLIYPVASLLLAYPALVLFRVLGWPGGLLEEFILILWLFLGYRFLIGLLYATVEPHKARYYLVRLLAPLFIIAVISLGLSLFTRLDSLAETPLISREENPLTLGALFAIVAGFYFWFVLTQAVVDLAQAGASRRRQADAGATQASLIIGRYVLILIGLFVVFQMLQLDTTTIAAITGGLSIGLGFALQDVIKNFLGGIIMLFEGTIRPGDWVDVDGTEGEVEKISIRATVIRRLDTVKIIVPNQEWLTSKVTTFTHGGHQTLVRLTVGVSYKSDLHQVREVLEETVRKHPDVLQDPGPFAVLVNFGNSSLDLFVGAWVSQAPIKKRVANELRLMIWEAFAEHGIEIPFPQRDIHIRSDLLSETMLNLDDLEDVENRTRAMRPDQ